MPANRSASVARVGRLVVSRAVMVLLVVGCGSSNQPGSPLVSVSPSPSATAGPSPSPSPSPPSPSASPSASASSATPSATVAGCTASDVAIAHSRWEGAAGSRGTTVTIQNVTAAPCVIPGRALVALVDADHHQLVASPPDTSVAPLVLSAGESAASDVLASNWFGAAPAFPVALVVALLGSTVEATGPPIASADDLPPCNGSGPATIRTSATWTRP